MQAHRVSNIAHTCIAPPQLANMTIWTGEEYF
jgi:hypothetical protein